MMGKKLIHGACEFDFKLAAKYINCCQLVLQFNVFRGVILYAMVCGSLPFGDDAQVKSLPPQERKLEFSWNLTESKSY